MRPNNAMNAAAATVDAVTLSPQECIDLLVGTYETDTFDRAIVLKGSPGIGKSSLVEAAANKIAETIPGFGYIEINPTMPADEVAGIPDLVRVEGQATRTDYALPAWFPMDPNWKGIINLDDGLQGDRMMQQVLANLIHARNLRNHKLPKGAMIVITGNRVEDKAGVTRTLSHLADRMTHINVASDVESWIDNFAVPNNLRDEIIGYITFDKSKLDMFDPNVEKSPTPRTWEAVSKRLKYLDTLNTPALQSTRNKMAQAVLGGELGQGEATRFWAFCNLWGKLPKVEDILKDPANFSIDYPLDQQYALTIAIANKLDDKNFAAALEYIDRIGADLSTLAIKVGTKHKPELRKSDAFVKWAIKNTNVVHGFA